VSGHRINHWSGQKHLGDRSGSASAVKAKSEARRWVDSDMVLFQAGDTLTITNTRTQEIIATGTVVQRAGGKLALTFNSQGPR
jgi:hypothetical protein